MTLETVLRLAGCARLHQETLFGVTGNRPVPQRSLRSLRRGDVLVVWKLDRLGRSLQDLVTILSTLERRGISFCSLSDAITRQRRRGKLLFHVTGAMAEFERSLISERTKAGMRAARLRGRVQERRRQLDPTQVIQARKLVQRAVPLASNARQMNVCKTTVWRAVSGRDAR